MRHLSPSLFDILVIVRHQENKAYPSENTFPLVTCTYKNVFLSTCGLSFHKFR